MSINYVISRTHSWRISSFYKTFQLLVQPTNWLMLRTVVIATRYCLPGNPVLLGDTFTLISGTSSRTQMGYEPRFKLRMFLASHGWQDRTPPHRSDGGRSCFISPTTGKVQTRDLYGYPSVHGAVFSNRKSYGPVRCGFKKSEILRCGSVRFSGIVNPTVRFGFEIYPTVRFGAV